MPSRSDSLNYYGRKRVPRAHRRVMLALLTGAPGMSGYPLSKLAQVGPVTVYAVLAHMESMGMVEGEWAGPAGNRPRRRFYRLTPQGRACVTLLLGLPAGPWKENGDA